MQTSIANRFHRRNLHSREMKMSSWLKKTKHDGEASSS
jgi:hypothetical protein